MFILWIHFNLWTYRSNFLKKSEYVLMLITLSTKSTLNLLQCIKPVYSIRIKICRMKYIICTIPISSRSINFIIYVNVKKIGARLGKQTMLLSTFTAWAYIKITLCYKLNWYHIYFVLPDSCFWLWAQISYKTEARRIYRGDFGTRSSVAFSLSHIYHTDPFFECCPISWPDIYKYIWNYCVINNANTKRI